MVRLDISFLKHLDSNDFRVLTAIEIGMKNHEIVPNKMIESIAGIKSGCYRHLKKLSKCKLIWHNSSFFEGYRLKYTGYDFLAIRVFVKRKLIIGLGNIIGTGKESDIFEAINEKGNIIALKLHRLGRTSFRRVKEKRDYLKHRQIKSWLYLSRLSASTEFYYMQMLFKKKFKVPRPIDQNRHAVLMTFIPGFLLNHIKKINNPQFILNQCLNIIVRLAKYGLIHCDFNEFNVLVNTKGKITIIDFPQMTSVKDCSKFLIYVLKKG